MKPSLLRCMVTGGLAASVLTAAFMVGRLTAPQLNRLDVLLDANDAGWLNDAGLEALDGALTIAGWDGAP